MRFIFNFIFYGILFYLLYLFFPEAFTTLVSWADKLVNFLHDLIMLLITKFNEWRGHPSAAETATWNAFTSFF